MRSNIKIFLEVTLNNRLEPFSLFDFSSDCDGLDSLQNWEIFSAIRSDVNTYFEAASYINSLSVELIQTFCICCLGQLDGSRHCQAKTSVDLI